jgi:hypothetical protein
VEATRSELIAQLNRREIDPREYRQRIVAAVRQWKREQRDTKNRLSNLEERHESRIGQGKSGSAVQT